MFEKLIHWLFTALSFLVHILPRPLKALIGRCIGIIWFDILRIRRATAVDNVLRAYPEKTRSEAVIMARESLYHMGYNVVELFSFPFLSQEKVQNQFEYQGMEKLEAAFAKGNGVFVISAHIGNGDLASAALSYYGFPVNLISKVFESRALNNFWFQARSKHGTKFIPPRKSSYEILKALKKNEMVIFVLDQYTAPPNGIVTEFFGIKTGTAFGLALFAGRSNCAVVPAFTYRKGFGKNVLVVGDPIPYVACDTKEEALLRNTQNYADAVEKMVRQHPDQWMWVHRRWKAAWTTDKEGVHHLLPEETTWPNSKK